jgi:hypothetical protein
MPKRKITLAEAFDVIEQHGLQVQVSAVESRPTETLADFVEQPVTLVMDNPVYNTNKKAKTARVMLYATHSIGSGGSLTPNGQGVIGETNVTYGPGMCDVPEHLAQHLLHQDQLARAADDRTFDRNTRSYLVMMAGTQNVARYVSNDNAFDLSGTLGTLHESLMRRIQ